MLRLDQLATVPVFVLFEVAESDWSAAAAQRLQTALPRAGAEELGMLMAHDLGRIAPRVREAGVCMVGASFDPAELLSPGLPLFVELHDQYRLSLSGGGFESRLLFLGAVDRQLPSPKLQPDSGRPPTPLRVLPMALVGEAQALNAVDEQLEQDLLERGECAPPVAMALASWFGTRIAHARYMTQMDLLALLRSQYEQANLGLLADLLEACLLQPQRPVVLEHPSGAHWGWDGKRARMRFQPLDPQLPVPELTRSRLRLERAVQMGLRLHGVPWQAVAAPAQPPQALLDGRLLDGSFVIEGDNDTAPDRLRAHMDPELGLLAVDAVGADGQPLQRFHPLHEGMVADLRRLYPGVPLLSESPGPRE